MLEFQHMSSGYGGNIVLKDIDVTIHEGEFVGIIGPNGSGKTTLMRVATKVIEPVAGKILLEGKNLSSMSYRDLATRIAVVGPIEGDFDMRIEDLVLLGRIPLRKRYRILDGKTDVDAARQAMLLTGLLHLKDRAASTLSSGERQLAFVARALAQEPKLLFLDEPTSHLDIRHQIDLLDLVARLSRQKGLTVVMILHDLNLASQYCERLLLLDKGGLHSDGPPESVLTRQTVEEVYRIPAVVVHDPSHPKPLIRPLSKEGDRGPDR